MGIQYKQTHNPPVAIPVPYVPQQLQERLGSGLTTPLCNTVVDNRWEVSSGSEKVKQSIIICLTTPVNRRLGQCDYGSELPYLFFEGYNPIFQREAIQYTKDALKRWVPQIIIKSTTIDILPTNIALIVIQYSIRGTSGFDIVTLALTYDDGVQLPPGTFTLGGVPIIGQRGNFS